MQTIQKPLSLQQLFIPHRSSSHAASIIQFLILFIGMFGILLLMSANYSLPERIEIGFTIRLPDNARNFGWYDGGGNEHITLAKFTVGIHDLEPTLGSVKARINRCISEPRTDGYMPDFYTDSAIEWWWQPFSATQFDGLSCRQTNETNSTTEFLVMVDYSVAGEATVYIERHSVSPNGS